MTEGPDRPPGPPGPPPRRGIVPLRPLELGDVLGGAFRYVRTQPAVALVPATVVMLIIGPLQFAMTASIAPAPGEIPGFVETFNRSLLGSVPIAVVGLLLYPPMIALQLSAVVPAVRGHRTSLAGAWAAARPRLGGVYGVYLVLTALGLVVVGVGYGLALLVGQAGGAAAILTAVLIVLVAYAVWIWLAVQLAPSLPVTLVEGLGVGASLTRACSLVRGAWWRFFGIQLVAALVAVVAAMAVVIPASILAVVVALTSSDSITSTGTLPTSCYVIMGAALVVVGAVLIPFGVAVQGLLYVDQRIRRERYDLDLAGP